MVLTGYVSNLLTGVRFDTPLAVCVGTQGLKQWYVFSVTLKLSATYTKKLPARLFSPYSSDGCESRLLAESPL